MDTLVNSNRMDNHLTDGHKGLFMMTGTAFLYVINVLSVQEWAGVAAIFAGVMTGAFNGYKLFIVIKERRKRRKNH